MFINRRALGEIRRFGKDITNYPKEEFQPKKRTMNDPKPFSQAEVRIDQASKDAIFQYTDEIIEYLHAPERMQEEKPYQGTEVTEKMRQILIDWLVDVHQSFSLKEETLHLAILYLEQFQSLRYINKQNYQLVGISCLWMASKYEEIYPPPLKKYVEVTAFTYTASEITQMEGQIIMTLNFNLTKVTPLQILRAHQHELPHAKAIHLAQYLLELNFLNKKITNKHIVRVSVAAAIRLVRGIYGSFTISEELTSGISESQIHAAYKQLCILLKLQNKYKLTAIKRKFSKQQYLSVGKITLEL